RLLRRDTARSRIGFLHRDDARSPRGRSDGLVARTSREQCGGPRARDPGRVDGFPRRAGPGRLLRAGDDRPLALVFPPRDRREPRGLRLHSGRLLGRADGRHGARHAPGAPSPPGWPGRESGGLRRSRGTVGNRLRGGRAGPAPLAPLRPDRSGGPLPTVDARSALRGTIAGASVSWLPGLSGGAAATLASVGTRRTVGPSQFMVVLGAVSTSTALLSVAVLFIIHRARSGAAAAVRGLAG